MVFESENFVGRVRGEAEVAVNHLCDELMETQSYLANCELELSHLPHVENEAQTFREECVRQGEYLVSLREEAQSEHWRILGNAEAQHGLELQELQSQHSDMVLSMANDAQRTLATVSYTHLTLPTTPYV